MMKRTLTALLAAMLLAGVLSGCSGSVYYDDPMPDGNVSTTDDGRVNGTNRYLEEDLPMPKAGRRAPAPQTGASTSNGLEAGTGMTGGR